MNTILPNTEKPYLLPRAPEVDGDKTAELLHGDLLGQVVEALRSYAPAILPVVDSGVIKVDRDTADAVLTALVEVFEREGLSADDVEHPIVAALYATGRRPVEIGYRTVWLPIDIWVVALDDTAYLDDLDIPAGYREQIEAVKSIYFFDRNVEVRYCSPFDKYYNLEGMSTDLWCKEGIDDDLWEEIRDWFDNAVGSAWHDSDMFDVREINRHLEANAPGTVYHYGNPHANWLDLDGEGDDAKRKEIEEGVRENLQGNPPLG